MFAERIVMGRHCHCIIHMDEGPGTDSRRRSGSHGFLTLQVTSLPTRSHLLHSKVASKIAISAWPGAP
jgi:hypothetical protein